MNFKAVRELLEQGEFRFLWLGGLVSQVGDWMQIAAQGWLVLDMTHSPMALALVTASGIIPQLIFVLVGGLIADRYSKKKMMRALVLIQLLVSAVLTGLVLTYRVNALLLGFFSFILGVCAALWQPLYLSFIPSLVPRERLSNAMGLSLAGLYSARMLGPILASLSMALFGSRYTYIFNTLSFLAPLVMLFWIKTETTVSRKKQGAWAGLMEGGRVVWHDPVLLHLWVLSLGLSLLVSPALALLPVFAKDILKSGTTGLGLLMGAAGLGQLLGALWTSVSSGLDGRYGQRQILGYLMMGLSLALFATSKSMPVSLLLLGIFSLFYGVLSPRVNAIIQLRVQPALSGRVQGLFLFIFGLVPVGQIGIGGLAELWGGEIATFIPSVLFAILSGLIFLYASELRRVESGRHSL